ncbi:MAG: hypothetical protein SPG17_08675 [Schaalia hyovaginalis]|uniref:hypothetical protein n=1 Tax=Schaalia hyovaginalis TaxID=29316 RepID=UPI0023FA3326|nr:hypothetical protein [Schaalia hyovaginalis]MCI7671778.1 hypothetical protein [Schaalia hyovaginalis]MDY5506904.1 hypothetical protein [Schaalia hyovaginalis]
MSGEATAIDMPANTIEEPYAPSRALTLPERLLTSGSLIDSPRIPCAEWDPEVLRALAGADRVGEISLRRIEIFDDIDEFALEHPDAVLSPNSWGRALGHRLRDAVERRCCLWLATASPESLPHLERLFGPGILKVAGASAPDGRLPLALNPLELVRAWSHDRARSAFLRRVLHDADSLRAPSAVIEALRHGAVAIRERSRLARLAINPRVIAYLVVFVYSSLRALPVALVPGFTGKVWVLWSIDIFTAIPYTWGVLTMIAGRTLRMRLLGLTVTIVTFMAPYIYFWLHGKDYPPAVIALVIAMILGSVGLEFARWMRDRVVARSLRRP